MSGRRIIWNGTPGPITFDFGFEETDHETVANWPPRIRAVGVVLTNYCPLACRHCYNKSSPKGEKMLSRHDLRAFIDVLIAEGHPIQAIGLSGGEAVYHPDFFEIVEDFGRRGLFVSCNTSGTGLSGATLSRMRDSGVREAVFSSDPYHEKFVSEHNLFDLIAQSARVFEKTLVKISVASRDEGEERAARLDGILPEDIDIVVQPVLQVGRAASQRFESSSAWVAGTGLDRADCKKEFEAIGVNYDGRVYACCSVGSFTPGLEICRIDDPETYRNLKERYAGDLALKGCHDGIRFGYPAAVDGAHKCEICHAAHRVKPAETVLAPGSTGNRHTGALAD